MLTLVPSGMPAVMFAFGLVIAPPSQHDPLFCPVDPRPHLAPMKMEQPMPVVTQPTSSEPKRIELNRGSAMLLQMTSKRPIVRVELDRQDVLRVEPENATTLRLIGLQPGVVRMTLYDDRGNVERKQMGR
jgi:hypothetical protein